mgnify:CR=1 FL=1|jgi:hypothetical protein
MITKSDISLYHDMKETLLTDWSSEINVKYYKKDTFHNGDNYEF